MEASSTMDVIPQVTSAVVAPVSIAVPPPPSQTTPGPGRPIVTLSSDDPDIQYVTAEGFDCTDEANDFNAECWSVLNLDEWLPQWFLQVLPRSPLHWEVEKADSS